MKKSLLLFLASIFVATNLCAQQSIDYKKERRIYLWDVTGSMLFKSNQLKDGTSLWDYVKGYIINDISQISNENTEVYVIPFGKNVNHSFVWHETATDEGKQRIIDAVRAYEYKDHKDYGSKTNLYEPLAYAKDYIVSNDYVDVVYMLNDGEHDVESTYDNYMTLLRSWCDIMKNKDVYTYYIMLTASAANIKPFLPDCIVPINTASTGGKIPEIVRINFSKGELELNVREDYGLDAKISWALSSGRVPKGYRVRVVSDWKEVGKQYLQDIDVEMLLDPNEEQAIKGVLNLPIGWKYDMETTCELAPRTDNGDKGVYVGRLYFEPGEGMEEGDYVSTSIMNGHNSVKVYLYNESIKTIKIRVEYE